MAKKTATKAKAKRSSKKSEQVYYIFGTNPETGEMLPNRTVTRKEWEKEKLEAMGYVRPAQMADEDPA